MNTVETVKILSLFRTAYTRFYTNISEANTEDAIELWAELFAGVDYETALKAAKNYILAEKHPPTPADLYAAIKNVIGLGIDYEPVH